MQYVIVNPYEHPNNDYIRLQIEAIRRAGYTPVPQTGNIVKSDCILYNWMENVDGNHKALIIAKKLVRLIQFKVLGKKIVWVMHNKQPHENSYKFGLFMMKVMAFISDKIMVLCDETVPALMKITNSKKVLEKVCKVPLISYESIVGEMDEAPIGGKLNVLLFGQIKPYKGVEVLLEALKDEYLQQNTVITIVGKCNDQSYLNQITDKIKTLHNVSFQNRFIELSELKKIVKDIHLLVLPMDIKSSLNSSAAMMAFSLRRTVICPNIGTVQEYYGQNYMYTYDYQTIEEHVDQIKKSIRAAIDDLNNDPECMREKGNMAFEMAHKYNSLDVVAKAIKEMLEE